MARGLVQFSYAGVNLLLRGKRRLKGLVQEVFVEEGKVLGRLDYIFCTDEFLWEINRTFLKHDDYTDIITFDFSEAEENCIRGEVYISLDRVKENAAAYGVSYREELARVMIHGALHLCGYRDKTKREISLMRKKEAHYLRYYVQK